MFPGLVCSQQLADLADKLARWIELSTRHRVNFGNGPLGKAYFALDPGHSKERPLLRRVNNPCDLDPSYYDFALDGAILQLARSILGEYVRFHHCKINIKNGAVESRIDLHQDFGFDPHTNCQLITIVVPFVDLRSDNGCLSVVPGSHKRMRSHFRAGRFVGSVRDGWRRYKSRLIDLNMNAGDCLVMDGALLHGSRSNLSDAPRPVFLAEFSAANALPIGPYHVPSVFSGQVFPPCTTPIAVKTDRRIKRVPPDYETSSIFDLQAAGRVFA